MSTGFKRPRYTQSPNDLFDKHLKEMGLAETKVVMAIVRYTFGYHQTECEITVRRLAEITGLSQNGVMAGAKKAEERGLIQKINKGRQSTVWKAIISASEGEARPPQKVRQPASEGEALLKKGLKKKESLTPSSHNGTELNALWTHLIQEWKRLFPDKPQPRPGNTTLKKKLKARSKNPEFIDGWREALYLASASPSLQKDSWFNMTYFLKNDEHFQKCLERWMTWKDIRDHGYDPAKKEQAPRNLTEERLAEQGYTMEEILNGQ